MVIPFERGDLLAPPTGPARCSARRRARGACTSAAASTRPSLGRFREFVSAEPRGGICRGALSEPRLRAAALSVRPPRRPAQGGRPVPGGVVDLSIGTPYDPPPAAVVEALGSSGAERGYPRRSARRPSARRRPAGSTAASASTRRPAPPGGLRGHQGVRGRRAPLAAPALARPRHRAVPADQLPVLRHGGHAGRVPGRSPTPALDDVDPDDAGPGAVRVGQLAGQPHRRARRPGRGRGLGPRPRRAGAVRRVLHRVHLGGARAHDRGRGPRRRARRPLAVEALEPGRRARPASTPATPTWSATCPRCASTPGSWCRVPVQAAAVVAFGDDAHVDAQRAPYRRLVLMHERARRARRRLPRCPTGRSTCGRPRPGATPGRWPTGWRPRAAPSSRPGEFYGGRRRPRAHRRRAARRPPRRWWRSGWASTAPLCRMGARPGRPEPRRAVQPSPPPPATAAGRGPPRAPVHGGSAPPRWSPSRIVASSSSPCRASSTTPSASRLRPGRRAGHPRGRDHASPAATRSTTSTRAASTTSPTAAHVTVTDPSGDDVDLDPYDSVVTYEPTSDGEGLFTRRRGGRHLPGRRPRAWPAAASASGRRGRVCRRRDRGGAGVVPLARAVAGRGLPSSTGVTQPSGVARRPVPASSRGPRRRAVPPGPPGRDRASRPGAGAARAPRGWDGPRRPPPAPPVAAPRPAWHGGSGSRRPPSWFRPPAGRGRPASRRPAAAGPGSRDRWCAGAPGSRASTAGRARGG